VCARVVLNGFNLFDFAGQVFVRGQQFAEFDESSNDKDAYVYGGVAPSSLKSSGKAGEVTLEPRTRAFQRVRAG
jgi:hypothetical protein